MYLVGEKNDADCSVLNCWAMAALEKSTATYEGMTE